MRLSHAVIAEACPAHPAASKDDGCAGSPAFEAAMTRRTSDDVESYFTGATATAIVQTSWPRLMISRLSFGPM